jgi:AcrR family transcriptional regulator
MSPAPARTSRKAIIAAGRALLEEGGLDAVSMVTVARRVGIKPPSLYKHVRNRSELLAAMATDAADELGGLLAQAAVRPGDPPAVRLTALAEAYRDFARRWPRATGLLFADVGPEARAPVEAAARAAQPVVEVATELVGAADALVAARALTAFAYGFTSMEAAGAFRLGGDVDDAFRRGIAALARGLGARGTDDGDSG